MLMSFRQLGFVALMFVALPGANGATTWYAAPTGSCSNNSQTCGTSYSGNQACCLIQDAMNRAGSGDTVLVKPGTYTDQLIRYFGKGITVKKDVNYPGDVIVERLGNFAAVVQFDCATYTCGANHGTLGGVSQNGVWEGFTIHAKGTGITIENASPAIIGNVIENCGTTGIVASLGAPTISSNTIRHNKSGTAFGNNGGGVHLDTSSATIVDTTICQNIAESGGGGGGIYTEGDSYDLTIEDCSIEGNTAFAPPNNLGEGGGLRLTGSGTVTISRCIIRDNQSKNHGGGIYMKNVDHSASVEDILAVNIDNSLFINNAALGAEYEGFGGAVFYGDMSDGAVVNCTFSRNYAHNRGGALYYYGDGTRSIKNSILWGDTARIETDPTMVEIYVATHGPAVSNSDVQGSTMNADPKFCDASVNNFHLMASPNTSPCIDAGDNSVAGTTDLDGNTRVVDGPDAGTTATVDMGCYEYQGSGSGCTIGGVPLACGSSTCGTASIFSANPPDGQHDARQPHPRGVGGNPVLMSERQGIGSPNTYTLGPEPITITLKNNGTLVGGATALTCWGLCETGIELVDSPTPALTANSIASIQETSTGVYNILLKRPISAGYWTTLKYLGGSTYVSYGSLPADVNANSYSAPSDILTLIDCINFPPCSRYLTDIDHSGATNAADITTEQDLLNGADRFIVWNGKQLAANTTCPGTGMMAMANTEGIPPESGDPTVQNKEFTDWIIGYFETADPVANSEIGDFRYINSELARWCLDHFDDGEKQTLSSALTDPATIFASQISAEAAADMAKSLKP